MLQHPVGQGSVQSIGRRGQIGPRAERARDETEGDVVARKARAAESQPAGEILASDPRVQTERVGDDVDVAARNPAAHLREHVGKRDLGGHIRVDRDFCELRVLERHPADRRRGRHDFAIAGLEMVA